MKTFALHLNKKIEYRYFASTKVEIEPVFIGEEAKLYTSRTNGYTWMDGQIVIAKVKLRFQFYYFVVSTGIFY